MMGIPVGTTTSFSACQLSTSSRCRAEAWRQHFQRVFPGRPIAAYRLLLLLSAVISCTGWCYLVRVLTVVASVPVPTSSLQSAAGSAPGTGTENVEASARASTPLVGRKRRLSTEEEAETPESDHSEEGRTSKTASHRKADTSKEHRLLRRSHPSPAEESDSHALERTGRYRQFKKVDEKPTKWQSRSPSPSDYGSKVRPEPTRVRELEGRRGLEEESRFRDEKETKEKEKEREVDKQRTNEEALTEGQKEEDEEKKKEAGKAEDKEGPKDVQAESKGAPLMEDANFFTFTKGIHDYYQQKCTSDGSSWCGRRSHEGDESVSSIIPNRLRSTEDYITSIFARPLFSFPFSLSFPFRLGGPANVRRSGHCHFTFTLDDCVPLDEARLYVDLSQRLVGLAADRKAKGSSNSKTYFEIHGEWTQSLAVTVVPDKCIMSDRLLEAGLIAWSCAGRASSGSRSILVSFPSEAHAKELTTQNQLSQEACDAFETGDLHKLTPRERCLLSGRTPGECDILQKETDEEKKEGEKCSFASTGYADNEAKLSRFMYA